MTSKDTSLKENSISAAAISAELEKLAPHYTEVLARLIQFESTCGNELGIQTYMKEQMEKVGLKPQVFLCREDEASMNVVAVVKGSQSEKYKSLVLNAHCDIAPVDHPERWSVSPFSGQIIDGKIYGRGAQDDKAGLAMLLMIRHVLQNLGVELKGDLLIQSVIEDETSGIGSKVLMDNGFHADGGLVCDGTWPERIIYAHLGQVWLKVTVTGEPVAACVEGRGTNPIYIAMDFIAALRKHIDSLKAASKFEQISDAIFVNVGSFHSGVWHGSVPSQAVSQIQIGFPPSHTPQQVIDAVKKLAAEISQRIEVELDVLNTPAWRTDPNNALISKLKRIIESNSENEVLVVPVTGHCDLRHFKSQAVCLYGPGGGKNAHGIDEHYFLEHFPKVAQNIIQFILEWCNEEK